MTPIGGDLGGCHGSTLGGRSRVASKQRPSGDEHPAHMTVHGDQTLRTRKRYHPGSSTACYRRAMAIAPYASFLGTWSLIPESCRYEQGEAPRAGRYIISQQGDDLVFRAEWTDAEGRTHEVEFRGPPDGSKIPFAGGPMADSLAIHAVSERELNSYAYLRGSELMVAQRQLDDTGSAMRITQVVRLPDGTAPANVAVYRRQT